VVVPYTTAGNYGVLWVALGLLAGRPVSTAATVWATLAANYGVKLAVGRERPRALEEEPLIRLPASSSFPSSHAAMSVAAAISLSQERPELAPLWWTMAAAMAASRVYVRAHHTGDVLAGAVVGGVVGAAAATLR
jgi:membrane-associated phospholipid phosphatase